MSVRGHGQPAPQRLPGWADRVSGTTPTPKWVTVAEILGDFARPRYRTKEISGAVVVRSRSEGVQPELAGQVREHPSSSASRHHTSDVTQSFSRLVLVAEFRRNFLVPIHRVPQGRCSSL